MALKQTLEVNTPQVILEILQAKPLIEKNF